MRASISQLPVYRVVPTTVQPASHAVILGVKDGARGLPLPVVERRSRWILAAAMSLALGTATMCALVVWYFIDAQK